MFIFAHKDDTVYEGGYVVREGCLCRKVIGKGGEETEEKLADLAPYLKEVVTYCDRDAVTDRRFVVGAVRGCGMELADVTLSAEELRQMTWTVRYWGTEGYIPNSRKIRDLIYEAIMKTARDIKYTTVCTQTGWHKAEDGYHFIMPRSVSRFRVELSGDLKGYRCAPPCKEEDLKYLADLLEGVLAPKRVMLPLISVTFLSPLVHFLKRAGCEPKFITAIIGETGARKSTLAALLLSFFGNFTATSLPMSFHDTEYSILHKAYLLKDVLTCIDDYHPKGLDHESEMKTIAQNISRYYGDRTGRSRLKGGTALPPEGNALITEEAPPQLSVSAAARYFNVFLGKDDINIATLSEYQRLAEDNVLCGIMTRYTDWLRESFLYDDNGFIDKLGRDFRDIRNDYIERFEKAGVRPHSRIPDMLACIQLGFEYVLLFLRSSTIDPSECIPKLHEFKALLTDSVINGETAYKSPSALFCRGLKDILDNKETKIIPYSRKSEEQGNKCFVLEDKDSYMLLPEETYQAVKKHWEGKGIPFEITKNLLMKQLAKEGIIKPQNGKNTTRVRIGGKTPGVMIISKKAIEKLPG